MQSLKNRPSELLVNRHTSMSIRMFPEEAGMVDALQRQVGEQVPFRVEGSSMGDTTLDALLVQRIWVEDGWVMMQVRFR